MASKLFLVDLDLNLNKAKNFRLEDFSTDPSTSLESGRLVYFTGLGSSQNHFKVYNGTDWKTIAYTDDVPDISISLDAPDLFSVSGSPADASGTLSFEWNDALANTVLAGPETGSSEIPTFRSLVDADIPVEIARVSDVDDSLDLYIPLAEKGEPLGVAELDENGVVPADQLDLSDYVTLTGEETLTNKTISDDLKIEGSLLFDVIDGVPKGTINSYFGYNSYEFEIKASDTLRLLASESLGGFALLGGYDVSVNASNNVLLSGTNYIRLVGGDGEYIGDAIPDNQIAKIGDLFEISATVTGTTGQISVEDTGTNDYVVSLPDTVTLGTDGNKGRLLLGNANYAESGSFGIDNSNLLTISSDYGDIFLATASGSTAYLGSITSGSQIATIGDIQALDAYDITSTQISNWDTAYGWGDHGAEGYLTSAVQDISNTDGNITFSSSTGSVTADLASSIATDTVRAYYFTARSSSASLFDDSPLDITIGTGSGTANIGIGSATSTVTINNDLVVQGDLTVNGDVTTLNTATMNVEDNIFVLNSNVTGTPSVDAGIEVERGTSTNASLIWSESDDIWTAGLAGSEIAIARKFVTTTTGTTHTITHGLATSDVTVNCWLDGEQVEAGIVVTDSNTVTVTTNSSVTNLKTVVVG
jgi:hypothetical protein